MSGSESYESLKISFADAWNEINEVITDGEVEIKSGQKVPVEVFLGGDYKVCIMMIPVFTHLSVQTNEEYNIPHLYSQSEQCSGLSVNMNINNLSLSTLQFLLLVSGRSAANSNYACIWCKIHKNER